MHSKDILSFTDKPPWQILRMIMEDKEIATDICRKETHTDHYPHVSSHHPVHHNLGIVRTWMHRVNTLIADVRRGKKEKVKVSVALLNCGYPEWALKEY